MSIWGSSTWKGLRTTDVLELQCTDLFIRLTRMYDPLFVTIETIDRQLLENSLPRLDAGLLTCWDLLPGGDESWWGLAEDRPHL